MITPPEGYLHRLQLPKQAADNLVTRTARRSPNKTYSGKWVSPRYSEFLNTLYDNFNSDQLPKEMPDCRFTFAIMFPYLVSEKIFEELDLQYWKERANCSDCGWEMHLKRTRNWALKGYGMTPEIAEKIYYIYLKSFI